MNTFCASLRLIKMQFTTVRCDHENRTLLVSSGPLPQIMAQDNERCSESRSSSQTRSGTKAPASHSFRIVMICSSV